MKQIDFTNILQLLFYLAKAQGQNIAIDKSNGNIYHIKSEKPTFLELQPLDGGAPVVHFSKAQLITIDNVAEFNQAICSTGADTEQSFSSQEPRTDQARSRHGADAEPRTDQEPTDNGAEFEQILIGKGKVNLQPFSQNFQGEIKTAAEKIEKTANRIFKNTDKKDTIQKTVADYKNAQKMAHCGNLFELRLLSDKLTARAARQQAADSTRASVLRSEEIKRKIKIAVCCVVSVSVLFGYFWIANHDSSPTIEPQHTNIFIKTAQKWQQENNKKIYPYGLKCLEKACMGITDENEIYLIITKNMQ